MGTTTASLNQGSNRLTWGKALKGVAMVAAVAVAGVAAFSLIGAAVNPAIYGFLTSDLTASSIAGTMVEGFSYAASSVASAATAVGQYAAGVWAGIPSFLADLGMTSSLTTPAVAAQASAVGTTAQLVGGGAAAAVTAVAVAPKVSAMLSADVPVDTSAGILSQVKTTAATQQHDISHAMAELSTQAGAQANKNTLSPGEVPQRSWRDVFSSQPSANTSYNGSWASKVTPSAASAAPAPRDPNYAKQLDADRANLAAILGDGGRA